MPLLNPFFGSVKVALRKIADIEDLGAFTAGGSFVQGVQMNVGDRFLLFAEDSPTAVTGIVGSGVFELFGGTYRRTSDADGAGDFETGRQVIVEGGENVGAWTYSGTYPTMTFGRSSFWAGVPPVDVDPGIVAPTHLAPGETDPGIVPPLNFLPPESPTGISGGTHLVPDYVPIGVAVRIVGIQKADGSKLSGII